MIKFSSSNRQHFRLPVACNLFSTTQIQCSRFLIDCMCWTWKKKTLEVIMPTYTVMLNSQEELISILYFLFSQVFTLSATDNGTSSQHVLHKGKDCTKVSTGSVINYPRSKAQNPPYSPFYSTTRMLRVTEMRYYLLGESRRVGFLWKLWVSVWYKLIN